MKIYTIRKNLTLGCNSPQLFRYERQMKELIEKNLSAVCGLELVASEFIVKNGRIDTLAYNRQARAFVIIEYKRDKCTGVIEQGLAYISLMLKNKASFVLKYNEKFPAAAVSKKSVNWNNCYVIYAAPGFTAHQVLAASNRSLNVTLWKVLYYGNSFITIESTADDLAEGHEKNEINQGDDTLQDGDWRGSRLWTGIKNLAGEF
jgi:hypothetical protein